MTDDPIRILQVGSKVAGADSRGGIATVMQHILSHPDPDVIQQQVTTYQDGSRGTRMRVLVQGLRDLARFVRDGRVDVAHVHMSYKGSCLRKGIVLWVCRLAGIPTILHCHSHGFTDWYNTLGRGEQWALRVGLPADHWVVLGHRWAKDYSAIFGLESDRVHVLHNPTVPPLRQASGTPQVEWPSNGTVNILFLGRLGKRKGCFDLVDALAALPEDVRAGVHLVMAGDGDIETVREAARRKGVEEHITFPGWIDEGTRTALFAGADVLTLPSYEEGLPMAILEALAAGVAVVTTPVGGIPEVLTDGQDALLHEPGDVDSLAHCLRILITEPATRKRIATNAVETSEGLSLSKWHARLSELWHLVASQEPRSSSLTRR